MHGACRRAAGFFPRGNLFRGRTVRAPLSTVEQMALSLPTAKVVPIREGLFPDPAEPSQDQPRPDSDRDDADLVAIDPATAGAIAAHAPDLLRHARRLMPSANDAQDLVQDTFQRAIRAYAQ